MHNLSERKKKQKKGTKPYEPLSDCQTLQAGQTLLNAAKVCQDERITVSIERKDAVAKEVKYHHSCYKDYTLKRLLVRIKTQEKELKYMRCSF